MACYMGLDFSKQVIDRTSIDQLGFYIRNFYALLLHRVAVADGNGVVFQCLMIDRDAIGCADGILSSVAPADSIFFFVETVEIEFQFIHDLHGLFG